MNEPSIEIEVIPVLEDNFEYLICWPGGVAVVDPAVAAPIRTRLEAHKIRLTHIFLTHDHGDHIAGVAELQKMYGAEIIAPAGAKLFPENLRAGMPASLFLNGGEKLEFSGLRVEAIPTPGHCAAHIAFFLPDAKAVFTGDCLFGAGCGRLFGNPPEIMFQSLRLLAALPDETRVFFGHEYTVSNLRFARTIEPENDAIARRLADAEKNSPTSPSTIALEKETNVFLRARDAAEFAMRRFRKDHF